MRHKKKKNTLVSKNSGSRMVIRNLVTSLLMFDKITTTKNNARAASMVIDKLITFAKKNNSLNAIRKLNAFVFTDEASKKVMEVLLERYKERPSGFTSMKKKGNRKGDGADIYELSF